MGCEAREIPLSTTREAGNFEASQSLLSGAASAGVECVTMASIKIRAAGDGSFGVYQNGAVVASGLTRAQAERCATVLGWIA